MDSNTIRTALGQLQDDPDLQSAWEALRAALKQQGGDLEHEELVRLLSSAQARHSERGEWAAAAELLELAADVSAGDAQLTKLRELAALQQERLFDEEAHELSLLRVLELEPDDSAAQAALAEVEDKQARWAEMAKTYLEEAENAPDDVYKSSMLMRAAEMELRFGAADADVDRVNKRLDQAVRLDPTNIKAASMLERQLRRAEKWDALTLVLERVVDRAEQDADRIAAGVRLGRLRSLKQADAEAAAKAYEKVLGLQPSHAEAKSFLSEHYSNAERWDLLAGVFERELLSGTVDSSERLGDMLQIAMLHWKKLENLEDAEPWFERIRKLEAANPLMLMFFREYAEKLGDEGRLFSVLQAAQRVMTEGPEKTELAQQIAKLAESQQDAQKAIEQYKGVLRQDPDNVEAREALKRLYRKTEGYNALVEILRQELERADKDDTAGRLLILREVASTYRQFIKSDTALVTVLNQILQLDPSDVAAVRELVALYEQLGRWRDLLTNQQRLAELLDDAAEKAELLRGVARRWLDQFSNVQNATEAYQKLLEVAPTDAEACERLEELYKKRRNWAPLFDLYAGQLDSVDAERKLELQREMAKLAAERLQRQDEAIQLFQAVLEADPGDRGTLDQLERQAERAKNWKVLAEALERRVEFEEGEKERLAVLQKLGGVYGEQLSDFEGAARAWHRVLELQPGNSRALRTLRDAFLERGAYQELEQLYAGQSDFDGLADVLSGAADKAKDPAVKIDLSYRAARVFEAQLGAPERAFRSYERILTADPSDARAASALIPIYEADEKWARLPGLYDVLLASSASADEQLELLAKLVEVTGSKLNDRNASAKYARKAYELAPASPQALSILEESCRAAGSWDTFVEAIEGRLTSDVEIHAAETRTLQLKLARVYAEELNRVDEAVASYKSLLEADPSDADAALALEEILRREGKRDELRWLLGLRVEHAATDADRVRILVEWATLEEEVFEEPARAAELYRKVLHLDPADAVALLGLPRLLVAAEDFAGAATVIEGHRDQLAGVERAKREVELAEIYLDRLSRPQDALDAAVRALEAESGDARAMRVLERLVEVDATKSRAAEVLAAAYASGGEARREAEALEVMLTGEADAGARMALFERLTDVHEEKLGEYSSAFDVMLRAVTDYPTELHLWSRADALSALSGRPTELAETYRSVLTGELPSEVVAELCERAAGLHEDKLGDPLGATPYLEKVLATNPGNERAFGRLKDILTAAERWGELEALYERASQATDDPSRRADMLVEVALICEEIIEDAAKATKHYERILDIDPVHETAQRSLDRLYAAQERHEDLARLLEQRLETAIGEERIAFKKRLAALLLDRLHRPEAAIEHVETVLAEEVNDFEARELAEKLLGIGSLKGRAARMLEVVYDARSEIRDLVRVLAVQLDTLSADNVELVDERKQLLRRIAELRDEGLHEDEGALDALAELVPLDPLDVDSRARLLDVGRRVNAHARVAEVLSKAAAAAEDKGLKGEILMQVAQIYEDLLEDSVNAGATYRQVLELDRDDPLVALPAARALERICAAAEQHQELAEMLRIQVKLEVDGDKRRELWGRLGELNQGVLNDTAGAIEAWRARLEDNPVDVQALRALDGLYQSTERWRDLVDVLERRADGGAEGDERRTLLVRRAETLSGKLESNSEAIDVWRAVQDEFGPSFESLEALERLYQLAERWDELADAYQTHLDLETETPARLDLLAKLGELRDVRLSDVDGALEAYREALTVDSKHPGSRAALEKLLAHDEVMARREAAAILRPIYEEEADHERLLQVLEIEISSVEDPLGKLGGLEAALRVADESLRDPARAFGFAERAVRAAAGHTELGPWLEQLDRLAAATQKQPAHVQLLCEIAPEIFDGEVQLRITLKIAELARNQLGDRELAREYYSKALELQSDDRTALVALESLYEEAGDGPRLLEILERRVEAAESDTERKELLFRRARLLADVLEEQDRAIEVYESILDLELDPVAISALVLLYSKAERWDQLIELYQRQLEAQPDEAPRLHVAIAKVAAERLNDRPRAFEEIESALDDDASYEPAIAALEAWLGEGEEAEHRARAASMLEPVYLRRAEFSKVMGTIAARLDFSQDPDERRELLTRLAQLHEEQEEDYPQALETMARLLHEDIDDENTIAELERLAKVAGAEQRLAEIYAAELDGEVTDESRLRLARRAGELFSGLGQDAQALQHYRKALAFEPESRDFFDAVDAILTRTGHSEERVELYRAALDHRYDPAERLQTLHVIAELQRAQLKRPEDAIQTYAQALDVDATDVRALEALTELYREAARWEDLAELYLRRAESNAGASGAVFRLELAKLYKGELNDTGRALDQLQDIVTTSPGNQQAVAELEALLDDAEHKERVVEILRPLYEESDDWRRQIKLNEDRYELAEDPAERVAVLRETARLWEERGADPVRARRALSVAFELDPDDADVRLEYQRLSEQTESWDELAATYDAVLEKRPDMLSARDVLNYLAEVHDQHRDDPRSALNAYERVRLLDEGDIEPVEKIEQLATLLSDWSSLVRVLTAKAELVLDDEDRASIWRRVGEAKRDMLEDREGAVAAYERAVELDPESAFTIDCLIELYETGGEPARLVELYQQRVELCDEDDQELSYELLLATAKVYRERLEDRPSAIDALGRALSCKPGDKAVLRELDSLYRAEERWPELLDNLKLEASTEEDQATRAELRKQMGDILASKLSSFDEALEAYRLVLDEAAEDAAARAAVRKLGEEHEDLRQAVAEILVPVLRQVAAHGELVEVLELRLSVETDPARRGETLRTIGLVFEINLEQPGKALEALLRALSETPEVVELHDDVERLAEASAGFAAYATALEERAGATFDPDLVKDLFSRLGRVAEEQLKDPKRAVEAYTRAVEQAGDQPDLLAALDRLYEKLGDHQSLADVLERRALLAASEETQADIYFRLATVQIDEFKEPARGLGSLRMALERAPGHEASAKALEGLTSDRELFEEVAELLEEVYRRSSRTSELAALYEKRVGFADSAADRIEMRRSLAKVLEDDCQDPAGAQRVLQLGLQDDPSDALLLSELERLAPITSNWEGAAATLRDAIGSKPDLAPEVASELCVKVAIWYRDKVEDAAAAEAALVKALEFEAEDDEVLVQLEQLQGASGRELDLIATLRRRAKLQSDFEAREGLFQRAKALADASANAELSEALLRELLGLDDTNLWALAALTELREAAEDYQETFDLLVRRAELRADAGVLRELRLRAATIAQEQLKDVPRAIELFEHLFEDEPTDTQASNALRGLLAQAERWDQLGRLLERLVDIADAPSERSALRLELARLNRERFELPDVAIELMRAVLDDDPSRSEAVVVLSELYEQTDRDEELAELLKEQTVAAKERGDTEAELTFEVRLGEIYESRLGDRGKAIATYTSVLDRDGTHSGALESLARLYQAQGEHRQAAEMLSRLLDQSSGAEALKLAAALADVYETLDDAEASAGALERGLSHDKRHAELRERLSALYTKLSAWEKLAAHIAEDAEAAEDVEVKVSLLVRAATLHAKQRLDMAASAEMLERASALKPDDRDLMLSLCDAYSGSGRGKAAVEVLERIVESYAGKRSKELGDIHRRLATAYLADGERERALEELDKAFRIEPGNVSVLKQLGSVSLETGDLKKAQQMFRALLLQKLDDDSPITKAEVFMNLGRVHHAMGEKPKATQMLERAIQADSNLEEAKQLLEEIKG